MARIPFPDGLVGSEDLPRTRKGLQNCFKNINGRLLYRPGILGLNTVPDAQARGAFVFNDALFMVFSEQLIKVTDKQTGAFSVIGTILGPQVIETAIGFNEAVIVVKGGAIYTLDKSDVLVTISGNANFVPCVDVAHIDGRFIYIPFSGDPAFFSDVGAAGTVQVLSFFDAEVLPDRNNAVFVLKNTLYICGTDSIEPFLNRGTSPVPFVRRGGGAIDNGFIGALIEYDQTFLFIGRKKNQDPGIFAIGQGRAPKISNEAIELILVDHTLEELAEAIPGRIIWRGNDIATFALRRDSFGFLKGNWFRLDTVFEGASRPWGAGFIAQFEGEYFTAFEERIGKFSKVNTDYGERITRIIDFGIEQPDAKFFAVQDIELGISQGFNEKTRIEVSTAPTFTGESFNPVAQEVAGQTIAFNTTGTKLFFLGINQRRVFEYDLTIPFSMAGGNVVFSGNSFDVAGQVGTPRSMEFDPTGLIFFVADSATDRVFEYDLTIPFSMAGGNVVFSGDFFDISPQENNVKSIAFSSVGTKMFILGLQNRLVFEYTLTIPFSLAVGNVVFSGNSFLVQPQEILVETMDFNNDGSKMYIAGNAARTIFEYNLIVPFSMAPGNVSFSGESFNAQSVTLGNLATITFNDTGSLMYLYSSSTQGIFEVKLPVPFSLALTGFEFVNGSVSLFLSRDNVLYSDPLTINLSAIGRYSDRIKWRYPGGLGTYQGFMGARILTTEDIKFSEDFITVNARGELQA